MYCPKCGMRMDDGAMYCSNCGAELGSVSEGERPVKAVFGEYAGFWRRFVAWIIDGIIVGVVYYAIMIPLSLGRGSSFPDMINWMATSFPSTILNIGIAWLYYAIMESSSTQATLGKMAIGVVVTDMSGNRVSFGRATGRHFAKIVSGIILGIGFLMIAFTERKQGLHDIMADTLVQVKVQ